MILRTHDEAAQEIAEASEFYGEEREDLGIRFRGAVSRCIKAIKSSPRLYSRIENPSANREIRSRSVDDFPYQVIYELLTDASVLLAVAHHSRKPGYWHRRKP